MLQYDRRNASDLFTCNKVSLTLRSVLSPIHTADADATQLGVGGVYWALIGYGALTTVRQYCPPCAVQYIV